MTQVAEFLSANKLVSRRLRGIAIQFDRLSDVWLNCERPDCMLDLLKRNCDWRREYRSNKGLERYIDSLRRDQGALHLVSLDFIGRNYSVTSVESTPFKKKSTSAQSTASNVTDAALSGCGKLHTKPHDMYLMIASIASTFLIILRTRSLPIKIPTNIEESQDIAFRKTLFKKQADLLRAAVGNPF